MHEVQVVGELPGDEGKTGRSAKGTKRNKRMCCKGSEIMNHEATKCRSIMACTCTFPMLGCIDPAEESVASLRKGGRGDIRPHPTRPLVSTVLMGVPDLRIRVQIVFEAPPRELIQELYIPKGRKAIVSARQGTRLQCLQHRVG